jgi:hypothetical protein
MRTHKNVIIGFVIVVFWSIVTHLAWFDPNSQLFFGDWTVWPQDVVARIDSVFRMWLINDGFGTVNVQPSFVTFKYLWMLLVNNGVDVYNAIKIVNFIPIAILGYIAPYIYFYNTSKSVKNALITSLFYGSTTYILLRSQGGHTLIAFIYTITPLFFYGVDKIIEKSTYVRWVIMAMLYTFMVGFEVRSTFIVSLMVLLYIVLKKKLKIFLSLKTLVFVSVVAVLNIYWILPVVFSNTGEAIAKIANRGLFGNALFSNRYALFLSESAWTGGYPNNFFEPQPIPTYLYITPVFIGFFLYVAMKRLRSRANILYFSLIALLGIILTKQVDEPFPQLYQWLYFNAPGFNLFREASKFYLLTAFGYAGIISLGISSLEKLPKPQKIFGSLWRSAMPFFVVLISCINLFPVFTGAIGGLYVSRPVLDDYTTLNTMLEKDTIFSRVWWLPAYTSYGYFSEVHPSISTATFFDKYDIQEREFLDGVKKLTSTPSFHQFLKDSSVKYVVVPIQEDDRDDAPFVYYGGEYDDEIRKKYIELADSLPYLEKVQNTYKDMVVYTVKDNEELSLYKPVKNLFQIDKKDTSVYDFGKQYFGSHTQLIDNQKPNNLPKLSSFIDKNDLLNSESRDELTKTITSEIPQKIIQQIVPDISARRENNTLIFEQRYESKLSINNVEKSIFEKKVLYTKAIKDSAPVYIKIQKKYIEIPLGKDTFLKRQTSPFETFEIYTSKINVLDENFDLGLWQKEVGDCSNYDDDRDISMSLKGEEDQYINLTSRRHIACTSLDFDIPEVGEYVVQYKAKSENEILQRTGLYIGKENDEVDYFKYNSNVSKEWQVATFSMDIQQAGYYNIFLYGYEPENKSNETSVSYDDIFINKIEKEDVFTYNVSQNSHYKYIDQLVKKGDVFSIKSPNLIYQALNEKFDNGLWSENLGNCLKYDDKPVIGQKISNTDTNPYLELNSKRHFACTTKNILLSAPDRAFVYGFDARVTNNDDIRTYYQNNDVEKIVDFKQKSDEWKTTTFLGETKEKSLNVTLYSKENNNKEVKTLYDNVRVVDYDSSLNNIFIAEESEQMLPAKFNITFENTTNRTIELQKASAPFALLQSENYNSAWVFENLSKDDYDMHLTIEGLAVYIVKNLPQSNTLNHVFATQKYMDRGLLVSAFGWIAVCIYLLVAANNTLLQSKIRKQTQQVVSNTTDSKQHQIKIYL